MASRVTTVVVDCRDPEALAGFWCAALGWEARERSPDDCEIAPPGQPDKGPVPTLLFQRVADPTPGKARLHLDLNATDRDQSAELERLLGLGARRADVGQTGEESWHVLADPEGNVFCLLESKSLQPGAARTPGTAPDRGVGRRPTASSPCYAVRRRTE